MQPNEIAQVLTAPLTNGQTAKTAAFGKVVDRQNALAQSLQLEQKRTIALHGAGSSKAQTVQRLLAAHQQSLTTVQAAATRAQTRAPLPNPEEYIIYGNVRGITGTAVPNVDVSVSDANGAVVQTTTTDTDGSYALRVTSDELGGESKGDGKSSGDAEAQHDESAKGRTRGRTRSKRLQPSAALHLAASDKQRTYNVEVPTTFQFELGRLAYQDLTVPV
jgi:hypothetical protein